MAVDAAGNELVDFSVGSEKDLKLLDADIPLPLSLVVARHDGDTLLVFNRWRGAWELPGGMIDQDETPGQTAAREFVEETGHVLHACSYAGVATFRLMPDRRMEYAAVYQGEVVSRVPFVPNDEIADIRWWDGTDIPALAPLDARICRTLQRLS
jgi:8-oxo-dGTP diphosphatase